MWFCQSMIFLCWSYYYKYQKIRVFCQVFAISLNFYPLKILQSIDLFLFISLTIRLMHGKTDHQLGTLHWVYVHAENIEKCILWSYFAYFYWNMTPGFFLQSFFLVFETLGQHWIIFKILVDFNYYSYSYRLINISYRIDFKIKH